MIEAHTGLPGQGNARDIDFADPLTWALASPLGILARPLLLTCALQALLERVAQSSENREAVTLLTDRVLEYFGIAPFAMIIYDNSMNEILSVSDQLKRRRKEAGLSLSELANRVGTSAATLSRYEHGWTRFETNTLRKLATALGCELRIELVSRPTTVPTGVSKTKAVKQLTRLFWDHHLVPLDFEQHPVWVTERVLEYGTLQDVRTLRTVLGNDRFLATVARATRVSPRTATFWQHLLKQEGILCTKKSYRNTAWNS